MIGYLVDAFDDGLHGGVSRSVHGLAVVGRSPRGAVDVDLVRLVAHRVGLDEIGHVGLVEHANAGYLRVVGHAHAANVVVACRCDLACTSSSVTVEPIVRVSRVRIRVVAAKIIAGIGVL